MSTEDIRRSCWNATVPVCFRLAAEDVASSEQPVPLYMMVSRLSYFPLLFDHLKSHFLGVAPAALDEIWLEDKAPLKWHVPVGVLFDQRPRGTLPWDIVVHFTGFPESRLMRFSGIQEVKSSFMMALKEANYLKHGDGQLVMSLSRQDQDNLWLTIMQGEPAFSTFWSASEKLLTNSPKSCALRVYQPGSDRYSQLPVPYLQASGSKTTLREAIQLHRGDADLQAVVQGVEVPLEAPVVDLQAAMAHGDGWLYVVLRPAQ